MIEIFKTISNEHYNLILVFYMLGVEILLFNMINGSYYNKSNDRFKWYYISVHGVTIQLFLAFSLIDQNPSSEPK